MLGGITVVLYGMIGLLGAKIWKENGVDFGNPINLVPIAAGIIIAHRQRQARLHRRLHARAASRSAPSSTIVAYHLARAIAPTRAARPADARAAPPIAVGDHVYGDSDGVDDLYQEGYPGAPGQRDPERDKRP